LLAQLPFLQLTGSGAVNLAAGSVDYTMQARVIEQPEFAGSASDSEIKDFTAAVIPLKITGPLASPSVRPDIEALVRQEVERAIEEQKEELTDQLMDRLFGGDGSTREEGTEQQGTDEQNGEAPADEAQSPEDQVKDALKKLFNQ
jgi:AsmA protein